MHRAALPAAVALALIALAPPGESGARAAAVVPGVDVQSTESTRAHLQPVADQPWPLNGRITNDWNQPVQAWSDTRGRFVVEPGQSTPWDEDVDYASISGHWYKIGPFHLRIDVEGRVSGFTCVARSAGGSCV